MSEIVFLFGGQGSQFRRMGEDLLGDETFRRWMEHGDRIVCEATGRSMLDDLYGPGRRISDSFDDLERTHPAIFAYEYAAARVLIDAGIRPTAVLGVSLGEAVGCTLAGVVPFESALRSLLRQARAFASRCRAGGMIAILDDPRMYARSEVLSRQSEMAGVLGPSHFVVAAPDPALGEVEAHLRAAGVLYSVLPLRQPFHSRWVDPPPADAVSAFDGLAFSAPQLRIISARTAGEVPQPTPEHLLRAAIEPMNFRSTVLSLEKDGPRVYVDLTPGGTLANLVNANLAGSSSRAYAVSSPFGREKQAVSRIVGELGPDGVYAYGQR